MNGVAFSASTLQQAISIDSHIYSVFVYVYTYIYVYTYFLN